VATWRPAGAQHLIVPGQVVGTQDSARIAVAGDDEFTWIRPIRIRIDSTIRSQEPSPAAHENVIDYSGESYS
jgi:hypothetical protein